MSLPLGTAVVSGLARLLPATRAQRLLTLIYHRVRPEPDPMFPGEVSAAQFDWQMSLLRRHCQPMALLQALEGLRAGNLPSRAVAVTFDDGYRDNATHALPILQTHGVPATFFVTTSFLGGGIMWNDAVIEALRAASAPGVDLRELDMGEVALPAEPGRGPLAEEVIRRIKHMPPAERAERVKWMVARCGTSLPADLMMSPAEVRQLHAAGMEIGAHTRTHPILSTLDADAARDEIAGSRDDLQRIIGEPVVAFAYPNGRPGEDYGPRERQMVEELGFRYAMATRWGAATASSDRFQLPRFTPWDRNPSRWLARLLLAYSRPA